jgi:hypothetical protein
VFRGKVQGVATDGVPIVVGVDGEDRGEDVTGCRDCRVTLIEQA